MRGTEYLVFPLQAPDVGHWNDIDTPIPRAGSATAHARNHRHFVAGGERTLETTYG